MPLKNYASLLLILSLSGCQTHNANYNSSKPHHTPDGFHNNYPGREPDMGDFFRWQWNRLFREAPEHRAELVPWQAIDPSQLNTTQGLSATWLGHATVLLNSAGVRVLTDPIFSERASPLSWLGPKRLTALPIAPKKLPFVDAVVISHNHYDHLDLPSLRQLNAQIGGSPLFIVPLGNAALLQQEGILNVKELDWWDSITLRDGMRITLVPTQHWSKRRLLGDRNEALWGGYVLQHQGRQALFVGDTGYSKDFSDIHARFGDMNFAMIPIGAYAPRDFMQRQHIDPAEAVKIHQDTKARLSLGIHWGTFILTDEAIQQPPLDLAVALQKAGVAAAQFPRWAIGETRHAP
ncbi:MAG: MBL fold metallo-hydrolase [Pseudomonadota bacterium]